MFHLLAAPPCTSDIVYRTDYLSVITHDTVVGSSFITLMQLAVTTECIFDGGGGGSGVPCVGQV